MKEQFYLKRYNPYQPVQLHGLPKDVLEFFQRHQESLTRCGFSFTAYLHNDGQVSNLENYAAVWINNVTRDCAILSVSIANNGLSKVQIAMIEFCSDYEDNSEICTHNNAQPSIMIHPPSSRISAFPTIDNAEILYDLHCKIVAQERKQCEKVLLSPENIPFYLYHSTIKVLDLQMKNGNFYFDHKHEKYRLTWQGAYRISWKLIWPMNKFFTMQKRELANKVLKELNG